MNNNLQENIKNMLPFESAKHIIESIAIELKTEKVPLMGALYRVLAEDVFSDTDMPPFNKSAMDGFACRSGDIGNPLKIIEAIPAGKLPEKTVGKNQCSRIMTGGVVPQGADMVVRLENINEISPGYIQCIRNPEASNICLAGEDLPKGGQVLAKGVQLFARHIAVLAAAGITHPLVYSIPEIAVLSTGSELTEPPAAPSGAKIRNSNAWQLIAQAIELGYRPAYLGIIPDNEEKLKDRLNNALENYAVIIVSGGVSVGDYDYVPKTLNLLGVKTVFHGIGAKPGRHILLGQKDSRFVFGLPGNPVSSFVQFEMLVSPLLKRLKGLSYASDMRLCVLKNGYKRKKTSETVFIPGWLSGPNSVETINYNGSAHIHAYINANCIIEIPQGIAEIKPGDIVNVRPL
ncbi:MAG: molybdopterin molybdotransferase MoeA [Bacteroidales bacterium]|nr:molybdopterin molybdotransferase MoeA [Bacteroidales bacterium]